MSFGYHSSSGSSVDSDPRLGHIQGRSAAWISARYSRSSTRTTEPAGSLGAWRSGRAWAGL